jgi:hypothetical protein
MILPVAQPAIRPTRITQIIQNIETSSIVEDGKQPASYLKMPGTDNQTVTAAYLHGRNTVKPKLPDPPVSDHF